MKVNIPPLIARPDTTFEAGRTQPTTGSKIPVTEQGDQKWKTGGTTLEARRAAATSVTTAPAELSDAERAAVVQKKATCPFIGSAVNEGALPVLNNADKPLASVDDVAKLGDTGKDSTLGDVLRLFAQGNHAYVAGPTGKLDTPAPLNTFSLDFPGSQGSHPGHSGILQGNPNVLNSGRFDAAAFDRLAAYAKNGVVTRSDIGRFIADNVAADPNSKTPNLQTLGKLGKDLALLARESAKHLEDQVRGEADPAQHRRVLERATKLLGEENLLGSAGEFALLATFLQGSPKTREVKGEPAYSMDDLRLMFVEKRLPDGWENWTKTSHDWMKNTAAIGFAAERAWFTRDRD